jgi:23S rRNA pseudouridine1911/1915/1917 synthase
LAAFFLRHTHIDGHYHVQDITSTVPQFSPVRPNPHRRVQETMSGQYFYHPHWPVLFEDNHLLALYKPAGLLVQGDRTGAASLLDLAKAWLKERYHKKGEAFLGLVHRLDRPVAGVVLFCRTSKAAGRISEQFRSGKIRKCYLAIVTGNPAITSGKLIDHLERHENRSSRIAPVPTSASQEARLSYQVLAATPSSSLVEIHLETGRHHQIRVQMSHLGHPLLGDLRYGAIAPLARKQVALIASKLTLTHPITKEQLSISSPLPRDWPWPPDQPVPHGPPWDWKELHALICSTGGLRNSCSFCETVKK